MVEQKIRRGILPRMAVPRGIILCFQPSLLRFALKRRRMRKISGFGADFYLRDRTDGPVAIVGNFGVGAPATVALIEELAVLGAKRFITVGLAGALQPDLRSGDLVLPDRAIRDEGTSYHYIPAGAIAAPDPALVQGLARALARQGHPARPGTTWTTDAPYREMRRQVEQYGQAGVLAVEMEAAAVFAAGECLGLATAAALAIADSLTRPPRAPDFDHARAQQGLQVLFEAARQVLEEGG